MSKKRNPLPAAERKALVVQAVIQIAAECNPESITTAFIAERMGLSQSAIFKHFPTKESIREEVMQWTAENLMESVRAAAREASDSLAGLEAVFDAHLSFVVRYPGVPRILFSELQRGEQSDVSEQARALMKQYSKLLCELLKQGKSRGAIREDLDEKPAAMAFIGMIQGLIMQTLVAGKSAVAKKQAQSTFAIYRRGIGIGEV